MFSNENEMQACIHENPQILLAGIPEINPEYCPDATALISLGREIQLNSGYIDNLYIDANAVLTFVECKLYSNSQLKREVYPQAVNYASDLQAQLIHFNGEDFQLEFSKIISKGKSSGYEPLEGVVNQLSKDPVIDGKNTSEWGRQFLDRLEHNIKSGVCRIVLLCAPTPNNAFNYRGVRNLMQLMTFTERSSSRYDILLMDLREENDVWASRIIWRRYAALPQIALMVKSSRDTSAGIDQMKLLESRFEPALSKSLNDILDELSKHGLLAIENTYGYALKYEDTKKSIYVQVDVKEDHWSILRHQIRPPEPLYDQLRSKEQLPFLDGLDYVINQKESSTADGLMFEVLISPTLTVERERLVTAVLELAKPDGA